MATPTVVAVYGMPAGQTRVQRLGSGVLPARELVVVGPALEQLLAGPEPPRVVRVGLGSHEKDGAISVELRDVAAVLESVRTRYGQLWALELDEPARSPILFGVDGPSGASGRTLDADELAHALRQVHSAPANLPEVPEVPEPMSPVGRPRPKPHHHPAWLWCVLFPTASFCPHRA